MNDRFIYCSTDTVSGNSIGENDGSGTAVPELPENNDSNNNSADSVSDSMGSDIKPIADTESNSGDTEADTLSDSETGMEDAIYYQSETVDYTSEIEYIDYLLNEQLQEIKSVQTVSGNSINVTLDNDAIQMLTEIHIKQDKIIESYDTVGNTVSCLLLVVCLGYFTASARRVVKRMFNRKGD